jgi:hypothetical protein
MSKQQAILETLLGASELTGNRTVANRLRQNIVKLDRLHEADGYRKLWRTAFETKRDRSKAA